MEHNKGIRTSLLFVASALVLGFFALHSVLILGQTTPERFWLAGRYDGNRVIVYFDAVKFGGTAQGATKIAYPIADGFFSPVGLSPEYVSMLQKKPAAERFSLGDRYDLLLGNGEIATITLTTLVGFESDEGVGNDSFIGALATPDRNDQLISTKNYYAVRRHVELSANSPKPKFDPKAPVVRLDSDPVSFDIQTRVATLITAE
jgi:hypothetical protein